MKNSPLREIQCVVCGKPFLTKYNNGKYCSKECRSKFYYDRYHRYNFAKSVLSTSTVGIISEYRVILDLLQKGYEIFHAVSPASSCDLAILKNESLLRVEVKTTRYTITGKLYKPPCRPPYVRADVLAIVTPDKIIYEPELTG